MPHYRAPQTPGIDLDCSGLTEEETLFVQQLYSIPDPNENRILYWNNLSNQYDLLAIGTNLSITGGVLNATGGSGSGDVTGPVSSTDNNIVLFNGLTGKIIKDSGKKISDLELITNKKTTLSSSSTDTDYPSSKSVWDTMYLKSAGCVVHPSYTDNGSGNITVANTGVFSLYDNPNFNGTPKAYAVNGITATLTDNVANYVVVDYNSGTPVMRVTTDVLEINECTIIPVYTIVRTGTTLHTIDWNEMGKGLVNKLHQRLVRTERYGYESGLALSETGTRNLLLTSGKVYVGAHEILLDAIATATDTIRFYSHAAGVWTLTTPTQYNNTQYDDGTNLQTLTNNRYAVNWVYRGVENQKHLYIVLGTGDYTQAQASIAVPPVLPTSVAAHALLVGKITVQKNAATGIIQSAFDTQFGSAAVTDHASLTNLGWTTSGHTGTADTFATFDASGVAQVVSKNTIAPLASPTFTGTVTNPGEKFPSTSTGITIYNTADETTNYERGVIGWLSNVFTIATRVAGSGAARALSLIADSLNGTFSLNINRITLPFMTIGNSSATGIAGEMVQFLLLLSGSSSTQTGVSIKPTLTQSGTAGYTALEINPTETSVGSGAKRLISAKVGGVDKFVVDNAGFTGINTTPTAPLEVSHSSVADGAWISKVTGTAVSGGFKRTGNNTSVVAYNAELSGNIELGHATDTTLSRRSAGQVDIEGKQILTSDNAVTSTNKRNQPRIVSAASYTTDTGTALDFSTCDIFIVTAQAGALKFNNPSGSPQHGEKIMIRIKDNGTARALTYDTQYRAIGVTLPTTTTVNKTLYIGGIWNATDSKLDILAVGLEA